MWSFLGLIIQVQNSYFQSSPFWAFLSHHPLRVDKEESLQVFHFRKKFTLFNLNSTYATMFVFRVWEKISCKLSTWNLIIINMELITTTRDEWKLLVDQYIYNKNKTGDNGNNYWECVERMIDNGCGTRNTLVSLQAYVEKPLPNCSGSYIT